MLLPMDLDHLIDKIEALQVREDEALFIIFAENDVPNIEKLIHKLNNKSINFFGGIFPGIIYGEKKYDKGAIVISLPVAGKPVMVNGLDTENIEMSGLDENFPGDLTGAKTAIVLVDGLTSNISLFLNEMFGRFGDSTTYFGGGAGSLSFEKKPCLFSGEGFFQDAAVIAMVDLESRLGVRHGWGKIAGPIVATKTNKNIIEQLNWQRAFDAYKKVVEEDTGKTLNIKNFFKIAKGYPFGIFKEGLEDIVRDPISADENGNLICVGEVPENTVLNILKGKADSLIRSAGQAADDCLQGSVKKVRQYLVADCVSRSIFLKDNFEKELAMVCQKLRRNNAEALPLGMLTLGEISSNGEGYIEFYNKTIVVSALQEG